MTICPLVIFCLVFVWFFTFRLSPQTFTGRSDRGVVVLKASRLEFDPGLLQSLV